MSIRITGGEFRGRLLDVPQKGVRPTQDRVRAALFSSLQAVIPGARVLDLFAGTGAFGLEAVSRGAAFVCFVENDRKALSCLAKNVERLLGNPAGAGGEDGRNWRIAGSDVEDFLKANPAQAPYDIVFADPPYDTSEEWAKKILFHLSSEAIFCAKGRLIVESGVKAPLIGAAGWRIEWNRSYGETRVCIYERLGHISRNV